MSFKRNNKEKSFCFFFFRKRSASLAHSLLNVLNHGSKRAVLRDHLFHALAGVDGSRMVVAVKERADALVGDAEHVVAKVHRYLSWHNDFAVSALGEQAFERNGVILRNGALDNLWCDVLLANVRKQVSQGFHCQFQRQRTAAQLRIGNDAG